MGKGWNSLCNCDHCSTSKRRKWVKWRPHKMAFPEVNISSLEVTASSKTPNKEKPAAYVPPALRGKPQSTRAKLHEFEPPENISKESSSESMSKSALKNKRKKEAKHKAIQESSQSQSSERQDVLAMAAYVTKPSTTTSSSSSSTDSEKQLKSLKKKLHQIEQLKEKQSRGEKLEANQVEKIKNEGAILEAIKGLDITST